MPFLIAFAVAALLTPVSLWLGATLGIVDRPRPGDPLKIHPRPVPVTGGLTVAVAALGVGAVLGHVTWWTVTAVGLVLAAGLIDDLHPVPPAVRLAAQVTGGLLIVVGGARLEPLEVLGTVGVILIVPAFANAVNMMDGQDGLAGGLAAITALGLAGLSALNGQPTVMALALAGSLTGFLLWNRPPARIFLGNGGAYAVGALLALLTADGSQAGWAAVLGAGACLGLFVFELMFTVSRRASSGRSLVEGDRLHSYDLLAERLGGRLRTTFLSWALGAAAAGVGIAIAEAPLGVAVAAAVVGSAAAALAGVWLLGGLKRAPQRPGSTVVPTSEEG